MPQPLDFELDLTRNSRNLSDLNTKHGGSRSPLPSHERLRPLVPPSRVSSQRGLSPVSLFGAATSPGRTSMKRRRQIYEGKAKILYEGPEPGTVVQYFKD